MYLRLDDYGKPTMNQAFFSALYLDAHGDIDMRAFRSPLRSVSAGGSVEVDDHDHDQGGTAAGPEAPQGLASG